MATKTDIELKIVDSVDTSHTEAEVLTDSAANPDAFYVGRGYLAHNGEKVIEGIDPNGSYPNMTVGNAQKAKKAEKATHADTATDLSGRVEATPEVFTYRPSAGDKSIKDDNAFIRRVKGNSVVWNQLVDSNTLFIGETNGMVISKNEDGSITFNGTASADIFYNLVNLSIPIGHKVALTGVDNMSPFTFFLNGGIGNTLASSGILTCSHIGTNSNGWMFLYITANTTFNNVTINPKIHYLTRMFGIGNEPTTVEEFRALYPDSYYPYNVGELRNLDCNGIRTIGFNEFNGTYARVLPNETYYLGGEYTSIGFAKELGGATETITIPSNRLYAPTEIGYIYATGTDICINLHHTGYRDGEYEPYKEVTHSLPLSQITNGEPLRKAGSVYDEINETHYIKRVGVVDLGSLSWRIRVVIPTGNQFFYAQIDGLQLGYGTITISAPYDAIDSNPGSIYSKDKTIYCSENYVGDNSPTAVIIRDSSYNDAAAFKAAMSGVMLNYELAEPIVTPIETPIDFNYYVEDFGTEEALLAEDSAPFSADIVYQFNATDQIRNNTRNIQKLQKSAFTPSGTSAQYIRGDGSYGDRVELSQSTPINDGEYEMPDEGDYDMQFILTPSYYAKSPRELDDTTTIAVFVTAPEDSYHLAEYWFEFAVGETLPNIEYYQPNNSDAVFRIDGDMMTYAVNILHLISSDGGETFFGEIKNYVL